MPEKLNQVPKSLENGKLSEESALLVSKLEANQRSFSFLKIFQYTKFSDYLWFLFALGLAFSFSFLQIGFTEYLANYTEAIRLNRINLSKFHDELYDTGLVMCEYGLLSFAFAFSAFFIAVKLGQSLSERWKNAYLYAVFRKPLTWHDKTHHETLAETIENDCFLIQKLPEKALIAFLGFSLYVMCWIHSLTVNMGLALFSMVIIPFQIIAFIVIDRNSYYSLREHKSLRPFVWETVENKKSIQENNANKAFEEKYQEKISGMTTKATFRGAFNGLGIGIFFFVLFAFSAGVFLLICKIIINRPDWWLWDYFILPKEPIMVFIATMLSSLYLSWIKPSWLSIEASVKAANKIDSFTRNYDKQDGFKRINSLQGKVEFKDVYFKQLKNISFVLQPGQSLGIVVDQESEKGAIADLIAGFYYCESGSVSIDGVDIKEYLINDVREFVSVVPQNPMILHKSFKDNICLGSIYSDEDIEKAAKLTNAHDFIMSKGGYSVKAESLSLVEKQKISLTRVILRDPKVLVIDKIYSVFDAKNKEEYSKIIEKCIKKRTSIVISEYASVIKFVENMIVLSSGSVVDSGKFEELSQNPKLLALQKAESSCNEIKAPESSSQSPLNAYKTLEFLFRILRLDSQLWTWVLVFTIFLSIVGLIFPIYGFFFADNLATELFLHGKFDNDALIKRLITRIIETVLILTSLIISCCLLARISTQHTNVLRSKVMSSTLSNKANNEPSSKYSKVGISKLLNKDCQRAGSVPGVVLLIAVVSLSAFACVLYYTFKNNGKLGIIILIIGPVFFILQLVSEIIANSSIWPNRKSSSSVLKNIKHIQVYNKQCYFENEYSQESNLLNEKNGLCGFFNLFVLSSKFLTFYVVWGVIAICCASIIEDKNMSFEDMLIGSFTLLFFFICLAVMFGFVMLDFPSCAKSAFRVFSFIDQPQKASGSLELIKGVLEFKSVMFIYPHSNHFSLAELSFSLHPNSKITVIGSNKAIPDLLLRHFQATKGEILIDGKNINEYSINAIRNSIAYAAKDPVVFAGGLRNNIDLAKNFSDAEIEEFSKKFEIRDVENWNSEDKKRISVARSVIKKPKILIVDEECEPVKGDWSLITLASTVSQTDEDIIFIEQGFVIEKGRFQDLMKVPNGVYRSFYQSN